MSKYCEPKSFDKFLIQKNVTYLSKHWAVSKTIHHNNYPQNMFKLSNKLEFCVFLNPCGAESVIILFFENTVDPDQLASYEAI